MNELIVDACIKTIKQPDFVNDFIQLTKKELGFFQDEQPLGHEQVSRLLETASFILVMINGYLHGFNKLYETIYT